MRKSLVACVALVAAAGWAAAADVVTLKETDDAYVLSNGIVTATVTKRSGDLPSITYKGLELINQQRRRDGGYWSHSAASQNTTAKVTIDPKENGGAAAEVSVKGISGGRPLGAGPGGSAICDIEIRYTLLKDLSGVYTYSTFTHRPEYPATSIGEARFLTKLNDDVFDWITVDAARSKKEFTAKDWNYGEVMNMKEVRRFTTGMYKGEVEHKYDLSANQFEVRAWGWSSTKDHVGTWFVNPTIEYLSGGPTKLELSAHRDATFTPDDKTAPAPPCLLNYWRGSHYGSTDCAIAAGEAWSKTIGPFLIYCNSGEAPEAMYKDALARVPVEERAWPYDFVRSPDYPNAAERGTVVGRVALKDPFIKAMPKGFLVGLTHAPYEARGWRGGTTSVDWQRDAKYYQFWVKGDEGGTFEIPDVRPGTYVLHAFAPGILGELVKGGVTVAAGKKVDVGNVDWTPVRDGRPVWEIGVADRSAAEFFNGDRASSWGLYYEYAKDFPKDVHYVIGKSDYHKDWNLMQVPHAKDESARPQGNATTWTIEFEMPKAPKGQATLRLAFAGTEARSLAVGVNGTEVATLSGFMNTSSIHRDSASSILQTRDVKFAGSMLKEGTNTITLTVPAGSVTAGVMYDYLRLELDENATAEAK